jgi:hypothetical protein
MTNTRQLISRNKREGFYAGKHSGWCLDFTIEPYYREWPAKHCRQGFDQYTLPLRYLKNLKGASWMK